MASSLFLQMCRVLFVSGPVSMLLANILMGSVAWAMLVTTLLCDLIKVDFTWRNDIAVTSPWGFHHPRKSVSFSGRRTFPYIYF
jgi:hypothetical protein